MKIGTQQDFHRIDKEWLEQNKEETKTLVLRAGRMFSSVIRETIGWNLEDRILIICGPGNNGADGLSLALDLKEKNFKNITICLSRKIESLSTFHREFIKLLEGFRIIEDADSVPYGNYRGIVDALLGTGTVGPARGNEALLIQSINSVNSEVVSLDIPSGLEADSNFIINPSVKADWTITVGLPKICISYAPSRLQGGRIIVRDIGFGKLLEKVSHKRELYCEEDAKEDLPKRIPEWHKNCYGHCVIWAGSQGKYGTSIMTSSAALKSGAGLVTVASLKEISLLLAGKIPEVMSFNLELETDVKDFLNFLKDKSVLALGPGIGITKDKAKILKTIIQKYEGIIIFDADALTLLSYDLSLLALVANRSVITPHGGEMSRLLKSEFDYKEEDYLKVSEFARRYGVIVVCKGYNTIVFDPLSDREFVIGSGNPSLAKGGSGDILTGILASVVAQKKEFSTRTNSDFSLLRAVLFGVWLHGASADETVKFINKRSVTAMDIVENISSVFNRLER